MRYCPICEERYDDEVIKFCTKDGTPLLDENEPSFTTLPSEDLDDEIGQETVISRREDLSDASTTQGERIVIPAVDEEPQAQQVRPRAAQPYYPPPPPPQPNTGKTIVLTILGTLAVLGFVGGFLALYSVSVWSLSQGGNAISSVVRGEQEWVLGPEQELPPDDGR